MSLPIIVNAGQEKWDCHQCGFCCRGSLVPLSLNDVKALQDQRWSDDSEIGKRRIMVRDRRSSRRDASSGYRLAHNTDGSCVFLRSDGLCRIHARHGLEGKPTVCQTFPLQLIPQDKQAILTIRRACPSAAADLGSLAAQHLPWIQQQVRDDSLQAEAVSAPPIKPGERRDWPTARALLDCAGQLLHDQRYPMVRRLVHVLQYAYLLSQAKTRSLDNRKLLELARTLVDLAPEESKFLFDERQAPKGYSRIMFRLLAVDCARLHPACRFQSRLSARWQLMKIAAKMVTGSGTTPAIDKSIFPTVPFKSLEEPTGALAAAIYQPLTRFIETNASSLMYALADRPGWSVVESVRGLALLYPVGLWLMRWICRGRAPTTEDMLHIVVALDRSQSYAPLSGFFHRARLATVGHHNDLERLVIWYAR